MNHPLNNRIAIDVDNDHMTGWPNGLVKLSQARIDGRPISAAFFDPHILVGKDDPLGRKEGKAVVNGETLDAARRLGILPGMRYVTAWNDGVPPEVAAQICSDYIAGLERNPDGTVTRRVFFCEYDVEMQQGVHDLPWQTKFLLGYTTSAGTRVKGIRGRGGDFPDSRLPDTLGLRWGRPFVFTMEGRQTTTTSAAKIAYLAGGKIGPQPYDGEMKERWDLWWEIRNWIIAAGIPIQAFLPYYGAGKDERPRGISECVLFGTTRLSELYV